MSGTTEQVWEDFLKIVKEEVGTRVIETWIKAVTLSRYDAIDKVVFISAPNLFVKNWVESHYKKLFHQHLTRLLNVDEVTIRFCIGACKIESEFVSRSSKIVPAVAAKKNKEIGLKSYRRLPSLYSGSSVKLNPLYTFDTFVVGENNSFACASAKAISKKLGRLYNPLLLYGRSGLGKTHLLHAIGNETLKNFPDASILYQTTEKFITEFIQAIRFNNISKFQYKYRKIDMLLLDDIQFMVNKEQTQEAFFHIFNSLYDSNKQIVMSSDTLPRNLGGLVDRLKSRLEWGLVADIQVPMLETKIVILKCKAELQKETLSDEVATFIANQNVSSVRELEGSLIRVLAYSSLTNQNITIELVKKVLGQFASPETVSKIIDFSGVISQVNQHYDYDIEDLRSKDRSKGVSHARQIAMYLMKKYTGKSLREIGEYLNRKDHTTIAHAIQRIKMLAAQDEQISFKLKRIEDALIL